MVEKMQRKILVVEDDPKTADLMRLYLERDGYRVFVASDGRAGIEMARQRQPHMVILDLMLPQVDGMSVCRTLRGESDVAIIMVTARATEEDKLAGLDWGADDYVTKPFSPRELVARVRVVLRRMSDGEPHLSEIRCGELDVDFARYEASLEGKPIHLTPAEFKLLAALAARPGRALTRGDLLNQAFGINYEGLERTIDVHLMNLRKKIEANPSQPRYILTVHGVGYKFAEDADVH
jgi:DNA-binding response OmpR family regulator